MLKKKYLLFFVFCMAFYYLPTKGQSIYYSNPNYELDDYKSTSFFIIGQMQENIIIAKQSNRGFYMNVYNEKMGIKNSVHYKEITSDMTVLQTYNCIDYAVLFLLHKTDNYHIIYGVLLNASGVPISSSNAIDSIPNNQDDYQIDFAISENKKHIVCFIKINHEDIANCKQIILNNELLALKKNVLQLPTKNIYTNKIEVNNEGISYVLQNGTVEKKSAYRLIVIKPNSDTFLIKQYDLKQLKLNTLKLKIDNFHNQVILYGIKIDQSKTQNNNLLYLNTISSADNISNEESVITMKQNTTLLNIDIDLENVELSNLIFTKDSVLIMVGEQNSKKEYQEFSIENKLNIGIRMNNLSIPLPIKTITKTNYISNDIILFKIKNKQVIDIVNIVKKQEQKEGHYLLSHNILNNGFQTHFLYNNFMINGSVILNDVFLLPKGPPQKLSLSNKVLKTYLFNIKKSHQITPNSIISPCIYNGILCFAKLKLSSSL